MFISNLKPHKHVCYRGFLTEIGCHTEDHSTSSPQGGAQDVCLTFKAFHLDAEISNVHIHLFPDIKLYNISLKLKKNISTNPACKTVCLLFIFLCKIMQMSPKQIWPW